MNCQCKYERVSHPSTNAEGDWTEKKNGNLKMVTSKITGFIKSKMLFNISIHQLI